MKLFLYLAVLTLGILSTYIEFTGRVESSFSFLEEIFEALPLILLCILSVFVYHRNRKDYLVYNRLASYFPFLISLIFIFVILVHISSRNQKKYSPSAFTAYGYSYDDGELQFDFKENGYLYAEVIYGFSVNHYQGEYKRVGDTVFLDIKMEKGIPEIAIIIQDTLRFIKDPDYFIVKWP